MTSYASRRSVIFAFAGLLSGCPHGSTPDDSTPPNARGDEPPPTDPTLEELERSYIAAHTRDDQLAPVEAGVLQYLDAHPDDPSALLLLAQVYLERNKLDESLAVSERCVAVAAASSGCWLTIGVISETKARKERAIEGYRRYVALAPDGLYAKDARKGLERLSVAPVPPPVSATPSFDKKGVTAFINERTPGLRRCYEEALRTRPDLEGRLTYTIRIEATGAVSSVTIDEDTVLSIKVNKCTRKEILQWTFPQSSDEAEVTFPVVFTGS